MTTTETTTHEKLYEYLAATDRGHPEIDGPCRILRMKTAGSWTAQEGEELDEDPDEYRVECECGKTFTSWGPAIRHAEP